jgi:elongation factor 1-gamma
MPLKLYANKDNQRVKKILIVAKYAGVELEQPAFEVGKDNKTEAFLRKNPFGKVPVLETDDGFLFESNAICKYVARLAPATGLLGRTDLEAAQVDQWLDYCTGEIEPSVMAWIGPILGYIPYNADIHTQAVANIKASFQALDRYLERNTYLVGERLTVADIVAAATLVPLYSRVWEPRLRSPYAAVNRWFETICMQESFAAVLKLDIAHWCTVAQRPKAAAAPAKKEAAKEEEEHGEEAGEAAEEKPAPKPKEEKKPKEQKPKEEKPKAEKPKKEAKPKEEDEADDDGADDDVPPEPKAKSTMDLLPKSTFILDAFKREYSNNKNMDQTMEYLWTNFDPEGYAMWFAEYKYQEENTVSFKTTNLVGGFYQRMERMHKYAFGQMLICGLDNKHDLFGFWIIRGQEIPDLMLDVPDVDLYQWTKISWPVDDETKLKIKEILAWGNVRGECIDGKTFK